MITINITEASKALFVAYAKDAGNWGGCPLVGANVGGSKEERGNLTQLKRAGLVITTHADGEKWVEFTPAGRAYTVSLGITI